MHTGTMPSVTRDELKKREGQPSTAALPRHGTDGVQTFGGTDASSSYIPTFQALTGRFGYKFPTLALANNPSLTAATDRSRRDTR